MKRSFLNQTHPIMRSTLRFVHLLSILFIPLFLYPQTDPEIKAFIIQNKGLYRVAKHLDFGYDTISANPKLFPPLAYDSVYSTKSDTTYTSYNSCILFFFFQNGKQVPPGKSGYKDIAKVASTEMDFNEEWRLSVFPKYNCSILSLDPVGNAYRSPSELSIIMYEESDSVAFKVPYDFLPGKSKEETKRIWEGSYKKNVDSSKYHYVHLMERALRNPMYISPFPVFLYPNSPYGNLESFNPNILEGNFSMPFTIMQGRDDQVRFLKSASISVIPEFTWRISTEDSAPLFPLNTKVGLAFNKSILDRKNRDSKRQYKTEGFDLESSGHFKTTLVQVILQHFSNGQNEGATIADEDGSRAPDFFSGNFSVNSVKVRVMRNKLYKNYRQVSWGGTLQFNIPKFDFEEDQEHRYGYVHLGATVFAKSKIRRRFVFNKKRHHSAKGGSIRTPSLKQTTIRLDINYVLDDISDFEGYENNPLRRGGIRLRFINDPVHNRSLGWFTQLHYGRDYLNIRYNVITLSAMVGLTFNFNKDIPPASLIRKELSNVYDKCRTEQRKNCFRGNFLSL